MSVITDPAQAGQYTDPQVAQDLVELVAQLRTVKAELEARLAVVEAGTFVDLTATGDVSFGTHTGLAAETLSGYLTITDAGGTPRKLGVIS